jgi:20S proteasome alpha/beta subunit
MVQAACSWLSLLILITTSTMTLRCVDVVVDAAQNSRRNSRYASSSSSSSSSYDRLISTFSPDGRLEQVEYSAQAATRTILASIDRERSQIIVVAPTGSLLQLIYCGDDDDGDDQNSLLDDHPTAVEDPPSSTSSSSLSAGHDHSNNNKKKKPAVLLWMIGTGIAGDVLWLRDFLREQALEHAIVWEDDDTTRGGGTVHQIELLARDAETICHRRTFVAGARPLGAVLFLLGFLANNDDDDHDASSTPQLAEVSGWNGAATSLDFACTGPHRETIQAFVQQRRRSTSTAQSSAATVLLETLLDAAQQVLGTKTNLDVWILSSDGTARQYTNVRDRASRRRLVESVQY